MSSSSSSMYTSCVDWELGPVCIWWMGERAGTCYCSLLTTATEMEALAYFGLILYIWRRRRHLVHLYLCQHTRRIAIQTLIAPRRNKWPYDFSSSVTFAASAKYLYNSSWKFKHSRFPSSAPEAFSCCTINQQVRVRFRVRVPILWFFAKYMAADQLVVRVNKLNCESRLGKHLLAVTLSPLSLGAR